MKKDLQSALDPKLKTPSAKMETPSGEFPSALGVDFPVSAFLKIYDILTYLQFLYEFLVFPEYVLFKGIVLLI